MKFSCCRLKCLFKPVTGLLRHGSLKGESPPLATKILYPPRRGRYVRHVPLPGQNLENPPSVPPPGQKFPPQSEKFSGKNGQILEKYAKMALFSQFLANFINEFAKKRILAIFVKNGHFFSRKTAKIVQKMRRSPPPPWPKILSPPWNTIFITHPSPPLASKSHPPWSSDFADL